MMPKFQLAAALLCAASSLAWCAEIPVTPADDLRALILSAEVGDELVLAPGDYAIDAVEISQSLTIRSTDGSDATSLTVRQSQLAPTFGFLRLIAPSGVQLEGLTLRREGEDLLPLLATAGPVAAIDIAFHSDPHAVSLAGALPSRFVDCEFEGGGGVFMSRGVAASFERCAFIGNDAPFGTDVVKLLFKDCEFRDNRSAVRATGDVSVIDSVFIGNSASGFGGALQFGLPGSATISGCTFENNTSPDTGAVSCPSSLSQPVIQNCVFRNNRGGSIANHVSLAIHGNFSNNLIIDTEPTNGLPAVASGVAVANNTFVGPSDADAGPAFATDIATFVTNNIVRGYGARAIDPDRTAGAIFRNNNIEGAASIEGLHPSNFDADPLFVDPASGDYRLSPGSTSIDAGVNRYVGADMLDLDADMNILEPTPGDAIGATRVVDGDNDHVARVDLGAFEYDPRAGEEPCIADFSGDNRLDIADVVAFLQAFGAGCP